MATMLATLYLTTLDRTMLRVYVRQLLVFPFPDSSRESDALFTLRTGLLSTLKQYPFLAGTIEQLDPLTGALTVHYPDVIRSEVASQMLKADHLRDPIYDFAALFEDGVPPSRLPSDVLCPFILREHIGLDDPFAEGLTSFERGQPIPVFATQATFIPGGLILSVYTHHSVVDGTGIAKLYRTWSLYTRSSEQQNQAPAQLSADTLNDARQVIDSLTINASMIDPPEFRYPNGPVSVPPLRSAPYKVSAKIIAFSASTIAQLAAGLSLITNERISTFTALTALVWCQVTNARRAALVTKGIGKTKVGIAIDHRKRIGLLLPEDYIGNAANGMTVSLPLSSIPSSNILDERSIAPVALTISNGLSGISLDWFRARLLHMSKQPNPSKLLLDVDTRNGPDIFITSWMHIGADDTWAIPGTDKSEDGVWGCKPVAIRKPKCASEGGMQILPRQRESERPFEVLMCLEEGEMERTIQGLEKGNWVERVIDG